MAHDSLIESIRLRGFLSFAPDSPPFALTPLNVLIGPNGSGKSNLIECFELLRATPTDFAAAIRKGGGAIEWIWKGEERIESAEICISFNEFYELIGPTRYRLQFAAAFQRVEIIDEEISDAFPGAGDQTHDPYYSFQRGNPRIYDTRNKKIISIDTSKIDRYQSILSQIKDPTNFPMITTIGINFGNFVTFREWRFGQSANLRHPQSADGPSDRLLQDLSNLALVLNEIQHVNGKELDRTIKRFLPKFARLSTRIHGGTVQFFLHEDWLDRPIPATRLSDGTLRFLAILASLFAPSKPPLLCIEEPELGLHPSAMPLMAELLTEAAQTMQLIVTTHSDILISALSNHTDSVVVCENSGNGTELTRLDAAAIRSYLEKYQLGEIWLMGAIGGNP